jgi:hypothetical protein
VYQVTGVDPDTNEIQFKATGPSSAYQSYTDTSHIMLSSRRPALGPIGSRLTIGTNTWNLILTPAQSALLEQAAKFRIASGGEIGSSEYTVNSNNGSGKISFTAASRDAYTGDDTIALISNGDLSADLSLVPGTVTLDPLDPLANFITLTSGQAAKLSVGDEFKLLTSGGIWRDSTNTVITIDKTDPSQPIVGFEATEADTIEPDDIIMVVTNIPIVDPDDTTTAGNIRGGSFTAGSGQKLYLDPDLAALLSVNDTFRIGTSADVTTLETSVNTVTGVNGDEVTFTASAANSYGAGDYIVFPVTYADLKGAVKWDHSMAQGPDKALNQSAPEFYSAAGLTTADIFTGSRYSPKSLGPLDNTGDVTLYPANAADLETQCFERFEAYVDPPPPVLTNLKDAIKKLLDSRLYIWSGETLTLSGPRSIDDFLDRDNGSNKGDLRNIDVLPFYLVYPSKLRKSGLSIDLGAYEN